MIYRCDDFPQGVDIDTLKKLHKDFVSHDKILTLSIVCKWMEKASYLVEFINNSTHFSLQLHGWDHEQYTLLSDKKIHEDIKKSIASFDKLFHKRPKVWYLPWNGWIKGKEFDGVPRVSKIAKEYNINVDIDCIHIGAFLDGEHKSKTVYFHMWDVKEIVLIPKLLNYKEEL